MMRECVRDVPAEVELLDKWYKKDTNTVPPVYILQPISTILTNFNNKVWKILCIKSLKHINNSILIQNIFIFVLEVFFVLYILRELAPSTRYICFHTDTCRYMVYIQGIQYQFWIGINIKCWCKCLPEVGCKYWCKCLPEVECKCWCKCLLEVGCKCWCKCLPEVGCKEPNRDFIFALILKLY